MQLEPIRRPAAGLTLWEKWAFFFWVGTFLVIAGRVGLTPRCHNTYPIFVSAARHWMAGASLYGYAEPGMDFYRYSPLVAALLTPLGLLPNRLGNLLWLCLNVVVCAGGIFWWSRVVLPHLTRTSRAALFLLVLPLAIASLNNCQANPLVLGLILAGTAAVGRERWNLAAVCLSLACMLKIYPLAVGLLLAAVYPRRFPLRLALGVTLGLALPYLMQHPDYVATQNAEWYMYLLADDRAKLPMHLWLRDVRLLFGVWLVPLGRGVFPLLQVTAGAGMAGLCLLARRARWPQAHLLALLTALACCWMTVFGPSVESCTYILLAPALAAALLQAWHGGRPGWACGILATCYTLLLLTHIAKWFPGGKALSNLGSQPLAGVLFLGYVLGAALYRCRQRDAVPEPAATSRQAA